MTTARTSARLRAGIRACTTLLAGCALHAPLQAADFAYSANLGLGHSDNIARTAANEQDENIASAGLNFSFDQLTSRLQANAVGNFSYAEYLDDTYDSELLGNFAGNARFAFVPQRFEWVVSDNFGQALRDPFQPQTPDNRENINYFSTGPDITVGFGSQTRLRLGGRYSLVTYEDTPQDFDTLMAEAALLRMLSASSTVSLNVRSASTEYDNAALNGDYDQREAFVSYEAQGARTELSLDAGYTEIERDLTGRKEDGLLLRLNAARRLTPSTTATLLAGREFSNAGTAFAASQQSSGISLEATQGLQTVQPFTNDYVTLGWNFQRPRTRLGLSGSWSDRSYEGSPMLDQTLTSLRGDFRRQMTQRTAWSVLAQYSKAEFAVPSTDYDELNLGTALEMQLSSRVSIAARYDYFNRSADLPASEYTENRVWLYLQYGRGEPRRMVTQPTFGIDSQSSVP